MTKEQLLRLNTFDRARATARRLGNQKFAEYCERMMTYIRSMKKDEVLPDAPY